MSDPLDLSEYSTAEDAAKALHDYLTDELDADEATLYRPEDNPRGNGHWAVVWEGGPYEWAVNLTMEESLFRGEFNRPMGTDPQVVGFYEQDDWLAEPHFSFDLQFIDN